MAEFRYYLRTMPWKESAVDEKTAREIRYVQLLCRYGRIFCVVSGVLFAITGLLGICVALFGFGAPDMGIDLGSYVLRGDASASTASRLWGLCVVLALFTVLLAGLRFMFVLFGNLERGDIFTDVNVRLLRKLAWVAMAGAALQGAVPLISQFLLAVDILHSPQLRGQADHSIGMHLVPGSFITALLLWLASWIMDVGRRTRVEAEQMRRDADLVI
jgi:hypothetical protein